MARRYAAVTNKEISQISKQAVPEISGEGDKIQFGSFKSDGQEISTTEWQELKNRFPLFFVHK